MRKAWSGGKTPANGSTKRSSTTDYINIGDWQIRVNEDGDLIVWNYRTEQKVVLARREEH